ncbi:MAG: aldehyde dehydrogenase family protein [Gammaproteobacteria bacterium]|nr:aldehyde dehydrogenase family protein [Gammaproteobacteria bacterium]
MATVQQEAGRGGRYGDFDKQWIAGQWRSGRGTGRLIDRNPYNGDVLVELAHADQRDLDEAHGAAASVQKEWSARLPSERSAVMQKAARVMEARHGEIVAWLIAEAGSTRLKAELEWAAVHAVMLEAAFVPYRIEGRILPSDVTGKECRVYRQPVGVVGVISPWNWPLQLSNRSVAPALAAGNGVVLKPASDTPVTGGLLLAKIFDEAGLPPGLLNVVVGSGSEIGDAFVCHPASRVISFTGSTPVGRGIARLAADAPIMKRVDLELGGNSPFVVLDDADLEQAVDAALFGKFLHQGQICMITNRFIVDRKLYEPFVEAFTERVRGLKHGDPSDADTMIGPIVNEKQLKGLRERIDEARSSGARQTIGGDPEGLVLPPHVFADVTNDMLIAREEIFGPVAPIIPAANEDEALSLANGTSFGLSSSVFGGDVERATRFALRMEAGMAHVNDQPVNDLANNPFGGDKNSGIGRFGGDWAVDAFTTDKWLTVQHEPRKYPASADVLKGPWASG